MFYRVEYQYRATFLEIINMTLEKRASPLSCKDHVRYPSWPINKINKQPAKTLTQPYLPLRKPHITTSHSRTLS